jgi:hypothetical protein
MNNNSIINIVNKTRFGKVSYFDTEYLTKKFLNISIKDIRKEKYKKLFK